jgi:hypothetical protein
MVIGEIGKKERDGIGQLSLTFPPLAVFSDPLNTWCVPCRAREGLLSAPSIHPHILSLTLPIILDFPSFHRNCLFWPGEIKRKNTLGKIIVLKNFCLALPNLCNKWNPNNNFRGKIISKKQSSLTKEGITRLFHRMEKNFRLYRP